MRLFCFRSLVFAAASAASTDGLQRRKISVRPCTDLVRPGKSDLLIGKFSLERRSLRGPTAHEFGAAFHFIGATSHIPFAREHVSFAWSHIRFDRSHIRFGRWHIFFARSHP
jgi:hypothetical protein